jgi:hypothetical protein
MAAKTKTAKTVLTITDETPAKVLAKLKAPPKKTTPKTPKLKVAKPPAPPAQIITPPDHAPDLTVIVSGQDHVTTHRIVEGVRGPKTVKETTVVLVERQFPAGEAVLNKTTTGMAAHVALMMLEDGLKNVRIRTPDLKYNVPVNSTVTKKLGRTVKTASKAA